MNKNFIVLLIVIISQFKNINRFTLFKKEIANLNNSDFIKNSKNHKRTFSAKVFQVFSKIVADKNKKLNSNQKFNYKKARSPKFSAFSPFLN